MPMILPLVLLLAPQAQAEVATKTTTDPKLVAVFEQNKGEFEKCMADVARKVPADDPALATEQKKIEAKNEQSLKDLQRLMEITKKQAETLSARLTAKTACETAFNELAKAKLKEAGADAAAGEGALDQWLKDWFKAHP